MAKKTSLKEFQQALAAKIADARAETASHARLGVQSGGRLWLIRLDEAGEVMPLPEITPVPMTRSWFIGMANIRGNLACVVDFSGFMGETPTERAPGCRLVLFAEGFRAHSGLVVERMLGLRNVLKFSTETEGGDRPWVRAIYRDSEERRWYELDVRALIADEDFMQAGI